MAHTLKDSELKLINQELINIEDKNYDIGDVSDLMKRLVIEEFGDEDWSTSGYWIRAKQIIQRL